MPGCLLLQYYAGFVAAADSTSGSSRAGCGGSGSSFCSLQPARGSGCIRKAAVGSIQNAEHIQHRTPGSEAVKLVANRGLYYCIWPDLREKNSDRFKTLGSDKWALLLQ